jgi:hypothetical protein
LKEIHEKQGFEYDFPNLDDPVFAASSVIEQGSQVAMAAFLKIHAEAYLFADPDYGTPRERWQMLLRIHEDIRFQAKEMGLSGVTIWIPPELTKKTSMGRDSAFVRRLQKLGWEKDIWQAFSFRVR